MLEVMFLIVIGVEIGVKREFERGKERERDGRSLLQNVNQLIKQ